MKKFRSEYAMLTAKIVEKIQDECNCSTTNAVLILIACRLQNAVIQLDRLTTAITEREEHK